MKVIPVFLALCLAAAPVVGMQVGGNIITITPEEVQGCRAGDGCVFATKAAILDALKAATDRARMGCGMHT